MLFCYRYVKHDIEKFQTYLDHLVKEVWCKAIGDFSLDLLHPDLKSIVEEISYDDSITKDHLYGPIRDIYELFKTRLTAEQRLKISEWYDNNNDIQALCACDLQKMPATYSDIRAFDADLATALKEFCVSLFSNVISLKAVASRIGQIDEHYDAFVAENSEGKCPYCGYSDIKGVHQTRREAYDHFLPKTQYPFNSVNFRNLAPICHECNSTYKLAKDPINHNGDGGRRKAYYTYDADSPRITISVVLKSKDVANLTPDQIDLEFASPGHEEEIETWKDVFGIEERYKAKLCSKNDGLAWLQYIDEAKNIGLTSDHLLKSVLRVADSFPYDGANFLKKPFLSACLEAKII